MKDLLAAADRYAHGFNNVMDRRRKWIEKFPVLQKHLKDVADDLNARTAYKQQFYVDKLHAYSEEINGTCKELPSITFRSGSMPMQVVFRNAGGSTKEYYEEGFHITFAPTITGQIMVMITPHYSNLDENPPEFKTMVVINDPAQMTDDLVDHILAKGIEMAYYSSFTGLADVNPADGGTENAPPSPIGFRKFERNSHPEDHEPSAQSGSIGFKKFDSGNTQGG